MYLAKLKPIHPLLLRSAYPCDKTNHVRKYTVQACKSKEFHGINETQAEHVQGELIYKLIIAFIWFKSLIVTHPHKGLDNVGMRLSLILTTIR